MRVEEVSESKVALVINISKHTKHTQNKDTRAYTQVDVMSYHVMLCHDM